ncbi:uncharacterized protein LOC128726429 [Anopheles nili]|uniref:uncharacterized protein LOC128726429 n=1 Tax=Anopheles nili TaxID=185578 RepID=UPI00237A326B|nr:uncharacterized protein LOC128726429 [Anopheles nili]
MFPNECYEYTIATESDRDEVRDALASYFYPEEPLTAGHSEGPAVTVDDMENALSFLVRGTVVLARTTADKLVVGLSIGSPSTYAINVPIRTEKFADIVTFLELLNERASRGSFQRPSESYTVHMLAVHPSHRGQSIGRRLVEEQISLARRRWPSCGVVTAEATSAGSLRVMQRLGMREIARMRFDEYRNARREQVFHGIGEVVSLAMNL